MCKLDFEPSEECIQSVISATDCTLVRAKIYLKKNQNDVEKAIAQIQSHRKSFTNLSHNARQHKTPIPRTPSFSSTSPSGNSFTGTDNLSGKSTATPGSQHSIDQTPTTSKSREEQIASSAEKARNQWPSAISFLETNLVEKDNMPQKETEFIPGVPKRTDTHKDTYKEAYYEAEQTSMDNSRWDFRLPILAGRATLRPGGQAGPETFSIRDLLTAVQHRTPTDEIEAYISHFSCTNSRRVQNLINSEVGGFPAIFYVVGANNDANIRLFVQAGGDVNAVCGTPPLPLLAFAIMNSKMIGYDTTSVVATLLSLGANENVVPRMFYHPFDQDLPIDGPREEDLLEDLKDPRKQWCRSLSVRRLLVETLNITQRYYLYRSSKLVKPTGRQKDVAARNDSTDLFAIPYFLIGQSAATELLTKSFLHYMLRRQKQPLVLVFAGPSGHGKTELARRLGGLLSLDLHVSDCTIVRRETELFGPRKPYVGAEEGSPLNNFLASHNGDKCIVFLDEFEKTTQDIWNSLLIPFDKGEYQDRRNLKTINCMNTIWILATNALDKRITNFCTSNEAILDEENGPQREDLVEELADHMKEDFISVFSPPLTGRISAFVPFLPFSRQETCVGVHKYLLELTNEVRRPVCTTPGPQEHLIGDIRLRIQNDASVCSILSKDYDPALGIRSLRKAVTDRVASLLDSVYLATHDVISEKLLVEEYSVFILNGKVKVQPVIPSDEAQELAWR